MFNSTILDVTVGLMFTFLAVSLAASVITEGIASVLKWRSRTLLTGVKDLLNDPDFTGVARELYRHALVNPRENGTATQEQDRKKKPAYIDPKNFAAALMDVVMITGTALSPAAIRQRIQSNVGDPQLRTLLNGILNRTAVIAGDPTALKQQIQASEQAEPLKTVLSAIVDRTAGEGNAEALKQQIQANVQDVQLRTLLNSIVERTDPLVGAPMDAAALKQQIQANVQDVQLRTLLNSIVERTAGNLEGIRTEIANWFDNAMDRVSGAYKRWTQLVTFLSALTLVIVLNISTIHVAKVLWQQPIITKNLQLPQNAAPKATQILSELEQLPLPIGWAHYKASNTGFEPWDVPEMILGWLITAAATLFGAPFWFDTLQQIIRLKGAGPSPKEKTTDAAGAA
jgi:hypothetical protein